MAKFEVGSQDHAGFLAIKSSLKAALAAQIEKKLQEMGEDVKGISWFSSCAESYNAARMKRAA